MFKWLLFDADNTLLDFKRASRRAFWETFRQFGLGMSEERFSLYKKLNHGVWQEFEQKKISAERLRVKRFELLFEALEIRAMDPAECNRVFLENLVTYSEAYEGVFELLVLLKKKYQMSLVTNGLKEVQRPRLDKVRMTHFFNSIIVSDEIGFAKPDPAYFKIVFDSIPEPPEREEVLIIGDNLHSDIQGGRDFGIKTCWVSHGKSNESDVQPDYEIESVLGIDKLLRSR